MPKAGLQTDIRHVLRILMRALREARKRNYPTMIDKLTAMNLYLQLAIRRLAREQRPRRPKRAPKRNQL